LAEFQDVIKHWHRMCNALNGDCYKCPIEGSPCQYIAFIPKEIIGVEQPIMSWADKNPEPVYPSWRDWLRDLYGNPNKTMTDILESPIDPEIARRLDIVPHRKNAERRETCQQAR
jgi:hypothetical protein